MVSGPSGGGKSTISRRLRDLPSYWFSVSATTRSPRAGEHPGVDYLFVTRDAFLEMRDRRELIEHSEHFGNMYGTPKGPVEAAVARGEIAILEIDINGADQVLQHMPDARRVFVMAPNAEELERRLRSRGTEDDASVRTRLARADMEIARAKDFDVTVINDDVERTTTEVQRWIEAEVRRSNG